MILKKFWIIIKTWNKIVRKYIIFSNNLTSRVEFTCWVYVKRKLNTEILKSILRLDWTLFLSSSTFFMFFFFMFFFSHVFPFHLFFFSPFHLSLFYFLFFPSVSIFLFTFSTSTFLSSLFSFSSSLFSSFFSLPYLGFLFYLLFFFLYTSEGATNLLFAANLYTSEGDIKL